MLLKKNKNNFLAVDRSNQKTSTKKNAKNTNTQKRQKIR